MKTLKLQIVTHLHCLLELESEVSTQTPNSNHSEWTCNGLIHTEVLVNVWEEYLK